jgi:hypothetical protein
MLRGRHEDALSTLARLHSQGDTNDPLVLGEYYAMKGAVDEEAELEQGWAGVSLSMGPGLMLDLQGPNKYAQGPLRYHHPILWPDDWCIGHPVLRTVCVARVLLLIAVLSSDQSDLRAVRFSSTVSTMSWAFWEKCCVSSSLTGLDVGTLSYSATSSRAPASLWLRE